MIECKRCLYNEKHPLGITFDESGICSGCQIHEEKDQLDWSRKYSELETLVQPYKNNQKYECIVPVVANADSFFVLDIVVNRLGLKPLVVSYNKYFNNSLSVRNLARLREVFGVDILIKNVNPERVKKITRYSLERHGNPYWPVLAGRTVFPVQTSIKFGVPLIIWGAHQGIEQVGMFSYEQRVEMTRRYRKDHDLFKKESVFEGDEFTLLSSKDMKDYEYPSDKDLSVIETRGIYLNNYFRWDYRKQAEYVIERFGYHTQTVKSSFENYENVDCFVYLGVHDQLKFLKYGYSKARDHLCREIRHGRLDREDAKQIEKYYLGKWDRHDELLLDWLGITRSSLDYILGLHQRFTVPTEKALKSQENLAVELERDYARNPLDPAVTKEDPEGYIYFGKGV